MNRCTSEMAQLGLRSDSKCQEDRCFAFDSLRLGRLFGAPPPIPENDIRIFALELMVE